MRSALLLILTLALVPFVAAQTGGKPAPVAPAFQVEIDVHPSSQEPYQLLGRPTPSSYTCSAIVTSPDTKQVYTRARLVAEPGKTETVAQRFSENFGLKFTVMVAEARSQAKATVEITRDGQVISRQVSRVVFKAAGGKSFEPVE